MAQQPVDIGTVANDGTGDSLRVAFDKLNDNDAELYSIIGAGETAAAILAKLLTVDGPGSGLDADLLDGLSSAAFAAAAHAHAIADVTGLQAALDLKLAVSSYTAADVLAKLLTVDGSGSGIDADLLDGLSSAAFATAVHSHAIADTTGLQAALDAKLPAASYTAADVLSKLLTVDGTGSGLDADLLDGQSSAAFAASSHTHTIADVTDLQSTLDGKGDFSSAASVSVDSEVVVYSGTTGKLAKRATGTGLATLTAGVLSVTALATFAAASHTHAIADVTDLQDSLDDKLDASGYTAADVLAKLLTVDGASSGLDADLLDGMSSAAFAAASHSHAISDVTGLQDALDAKLASSSYTAADVLSKLLTVDGASSGLDADLLDGISSAGFLQTSTYEALTPTWAGLHTYTANVLLTSANPRIRILETGLASDTGAWDFSWDAGTVSLRTRTDADGAGVSAITVTRPSGTSPRRVFLGPTDADLSGFSSAAGNTSNYAVVFGGFDVASNSAFAFISAQRPSLALLKYGTSLTSPAQIGNNIALHQLALSCYNTDTSAIATCCAISTTSTEAWGSTAQGARMDFAVTPNGTTSRVTSLRLAESQIQSLDGTNSLPSRAFQNDIDTGDYRIAANQYGISCGGTLVMDIATSLVAITATTLRFNTTTATTVGAAGGANALPATPLGYLAANVGGTAVKIPYYNN